jgi:translocator protein
MDRRQISASKRLTTKRSQATTPEIYWLGLAGFVVTCLIAAAMGASLTSPGLAHWYPALRKPSWTPPAWVFGSVSTALYLAMAVAAWRIWIERRAKARRIALMLFAAQLLFNIGWPLLFFTLRVPGAAAIEVGLLWLAVLATTVVFYPVSRIAALLMTPYLLWTTFAVFLNIAIWRFNG